MVLLAIGYGWSFVHARDAAARGEPVNSAARSITAALTSADAPSTAFLTEAALLAFTRSARGLSGRLAVQTALPGDTLRPDSLPEGARLVYDDHAAVENGESRPSTPGVRQVAVAAGKALQPVKNLSLITMLPFSAKQRGRIGLYYIGSFPSEQGARGPSKAPADRYANPRGFIQVTLENRDTPVSEHFQLKDFLTKNQPNVWPKYLVLEMRLVDKLELVLADLRSRGVRTEGVVVMSGFRTPSYNSGGGNTAGRANLSRHTFGDGADIYIDNDGNGNMDDLNRDGRIDIGDSRFILEAVERVERQFPQLVGGAGVYIACCGHGPFIHIDTRGYRARWTGSSGG
ncbi:MAG TPA: hypothetical protein VFO66_01870 [Gemmatimonadaceae bacterium]|nr:hypothetical protein [Gemmatimonadaceae bacterium]